MNHCKRCGDHIPARSTTTLCSRCALHKTFVVDDEKGVPVGGIIPIIASFDTEAEASEYIGTLPDYQSGRYGITGPNEDI